MTRLTILAVVVAAPVAAQEPDRLTAVLDSTRVALGAPGASAAIVSGDTVVWAGVSGLAGPGRPVTVETVFELASVTKVYTAALALLLVQEEALSLDDPLARWYPEIEGAERITVRQLLNHTSGLHDPTQTDSYIQLILANPSRRWTPDEFVAERDEPYFAPGSGWHYTNTGFLLAGRIIERVAGAEFGVLLRERLTHPLNLSHTLYAVTDAVPPSRSESYIDTNGDGTPDAISLFMPKTAFLSSAGAAGAVMATAGDAARFLHGILTGDILAPAQRQAMRDWVDRPDGNRYGLGLLSLEGERRRLIGHLGNSAGFSAAVLHDPVRGVTVAVLTNGHSINVTPAVRALLNGASDVSSLPSSSDGRR